MMAWPEQLCHRTASGQFDGVRVKVVEHQGHGEERGGSLSGFVRICPDGTYE